MKKQFHRKDWKTFLASLNSTCIIEIPPNLSMIQLIKTFVRIAKDICLQIQVLLVNLL